MSAISKVLVVDWISTSSAKVMSSDGGESLERSFD